MGFRELRENPRIPRHGAGSSGIAVAQRQMSFLPSTNASTGVTPMSSGMPWHDHIEAAVKTVGRIARNLAAGTTHY